MKIGIRSFLFVLVCANLPLVLLGQQHQEPDLIGLSGVLISADGLKPIPDAEVFSQENYTGTFTDSDGRFTLAIALGDTLLFSSLGYSDMVVAVDDSLLSLKLPIRFYMKMDTIEIPEVVIHALWNYTIFKQKIGDMKQQTHPLNLFNNSKKPPSHQKPYDVGFHLFSPIQSMYNLFNAQEVLQRKLIHNRKAYNRHMIKIGRPQDTIPSKPDYMREKKH